MSMRRCARGCAALRRCPISNRFRHHRNLRKLEKRMSASPFNFDELTAQGLAGGGPRSVSGIRDFMPEQHRLFFAQLPYLFVAAIDTAGWPLATLLTGKPGFVQSPDPVTLHLLALPKVGDPAAEALIPNREIGILGIDFSTRRRNRANGRIRSRDAHAISVTV